MKLINSYEAILHKKSDIASKISNMEPIELMVGLLKVVIIWRMSKLKWFDKTVVELSSHIWTEIIIEFPIDYKLALQKMKDLLLSQVSK